MMRIALCDDEREQLSKIESFLREYQAARNDINMNVTSLLSGAELLEHIKTYGAFDLYLLDVLMPEENGIDVGLKIRQSDKCGTIFYLTSSVDYAVDAFGARASQYLLKPIDKARLFDDLDAFCEDWLQKRQSFATIKTRTGMQRIPIGSIVYGDLVGRCVHYHLSDGSKIEGMSLRTSFRDAVRDLLEDARFALCAVSFVVNLAYVENINGSELNLAGGGSLPVSRQHRKALVNEWLDYHLKNGGGNIC